MTVKCYGMILGKIRRRKQIKAVTVARHLGISASTYSRIETGHISATFETVTDICGELGVTLAQFNELLHQRSESRTGGETKI